MASKQEIEIKFRIVGMRGLASKLRYAGFRVVTPRTREINTLYDLPGQALRERRELLRLRRYGRKWTLTHKSGKKTGRHSSRRELETTVGDGKRMDLILRALGYAPWFRYEKFRSEWTDGKGAVVVDQTPIGNFCEIEGAPHWIDRTAVKLGVDPSEYLTSNYASLFHDWKERTRSGAKEMTFEAVRGQAGTDPPVS